MIVTAVLKAVFTLSFVATGAVLGAAATVMVMVAAFEVAPSSSLTVYVFEAEPEKSVVGVKVTTPKVFTV